MKKLILPFLALLLLSACGRAEPIPYLTDGSCAWDNITEIRIYADGYYDRSPEQPLVITDSETIGKLLDAALDVGKYRPVAQNKALEGLNGLWIDFGNGCVLGMYADTNYGSFSSAMETTGSPCYRLPKSLWNLTKELLENTP